MGHNVPSRYIVIINNPDSQPIQSFHETYDEAYEYYLVNKASQQWDNNDRVYLTKIIHGPMLVGEWSVRTEKILCPKCKGSCLAEEINPKHCASSCQNTLKHTEIDTHYLWCTDCDYKFLYPDREYEEI